MSQFAFLETEFPQVYMRAQVAEQRARSDARAACMNARFALEEMLTWLYRHERSLRQPYEKTLSALIHEPSFAVLVGPNLLAKARLIKDHGNAAVHDGRAFAPQNALIAVRELFHIGFWLVRNYGRSQRPAPDLRFDSNLLPQYAQVEASTLLQLQETAARYQAQSRSLEEAQAARVRSEADFAALQAELTALHAQVAAQVAQNQAVPDTHDYDEAQTRADIIDLLLHEAGWALDQKRDREFPVAGLPSHDGNVSGRGFVDYVLWGDNGKPLALIEAKRSTRDAQAGQQQAKNYADCLEKTFCVRPLIFYTNGFQTWHWDDGAYPPRVVQGFYKKSELELWRQRKTSRLGLLATAIDHKIVERPYQHRALRRINEAFEQNHQRKALLVMATGSGKTRTVIALVDQLMRAGWVKRVLFLADRVALVKQAQREFAKHLPSASSANLVERSNVGSNDHRGARLCFATYPTMINQIDELDGAERRFGPGHFDLVVIDEAHRSVYKKYRSIFAYFDSFLVGLTATPRDEIDHNTYSLFELEDGVPTDAYDLEQAVREGYLVPPRAIATPLQFVQQGMHYDELTPEEQERWDELEFTGELPGDQVLSSQMNKVVFNTDTNDKVLERLMLDGLKVAGGDRLGKTIIFAKNHAHASFIAERFNVNYPETNGEFARVIDFQTEGAQQLIDQFSIVGAMPHIAISVDMLDTGIDVPEVLNLVFFKIVRSKTKFFQMIGRGTRLCPNIFGPGQHKTEFLIFDYCGNFEFFRQNPDAYEGSARASIGARLFVHRVLIAAALEDLNAEPVCERAQQLNTDVRQRLISEVADMNLANFIVRMQREAVEHFQKRESWTRLSAEDRETLVSNIAGLPSALIDNELEAKQFDLIMLGAELALLRGDARFAQYQEQITGIAAALEAISANVGVVRAELALILEIQTDEYWQNIDAWTLEQARRRLRSFVKLLRGDGSKAVFTDFEDQIGEGVEVTLPNITPGFDRARFERKMLHFLRTHENHITILKLRRNEQLTPQDLNELERILIAQGEITELELDRTRAIGGLGVFVRALIGMEAAIVQSLFAEFLSNQNLNANQIQFVQLIIRHLTEKGVMEAQRLYESPFTDLNDQGISGLFDQETVQHIVAVLDSVRGRAAA